MFSLSRSGRKICARSVGEGYRRRSWVTHDASILISFGAGREIAIDDILGLESLRRNPRSRRIAPSVEANGRLPLKGEWAGLLRGLIAGRCGAISFEAKARCASIQKGVHRWTIDPVLTLPGQRQTLPGEGRAARSEGEVKSLKISIRATNMPTMGVHRPTARRNPPPSRSTDTIAIGMGGLLRRVEPAIYIKATPATNRIKIRPVPGQPPAKVEYKRRNGRTFPQLIYFQCFPEWNGTPNECGSSLFRGIRVRKKNRPETTAR